MQQCSQAVEKRKRIGVSHVVKEREPSSRNKRWFSSSNSHQERSSGSALEIRLMELKGSRQSRTYSVDYAKRSTKCNLGWLVTDVRKK